MEIPAAIEWLRVALGLFFVPHIIGKLRPPHAPLEFFRALGVPAPRAVMFCAAFIESVICIGLVFGLMPGAAAWLGAAYLVCACAALLKVGGRHPWFWIEGGIEYPALWAVVCVAVALAQRPVA